jgi:hypothetical protein
MGEHTKLFACPFCGADAQIEHGSDHHGTWFNLGCSRHWGSSLVDADHGCIGGRIYYTETETPEVEAIAAWNTRAAPPAMDREAVEQIEKLKPGYPDYVDDPDGLDRFREQVKRESGHDMAVCNNNSLGRLIDTIERLRFERDQALSTLSADAIRQGEGVENGYTADDAVDFVFNRLASKLGLADWQVVEGSEEWEGDVSATLHRLLVDAGIIDDETGAVATLATPASHASDGGKAA